MSDLDTRNGHAGPRPAQLSFGATSHALVPAETERRPAPAGGAHAHGGRPKAPPAGKQARNGNGRFGKTRGPKEPGTDKPRRAGRGATSAAALKQARERGVTYGGNRRVYRVGLGMLGAFVALSMYGACNSLTKPSRSEIAAIVDTRIADNDAFPTGPAVMWAGQVVRTWGTWDEKNPDVRRIGLAPFLSAGLEQDAGWSGRGTQNVVYASINPQPRITDAHHAQIDAAYQIQDGSWHCVTLPIYTATPPEGGNTQAAFSLAGNPTPIGCQPRTGTPGDTGDSAPAGTAWQSQTDTETTGFFAGFFAAWASSDAGTLAQYTAPGITVLGLGGGMQASPAPTVADVALAMPTGTDQPTNGTVYQARMRVTWTVANSTSQITSTYQVPVRRDGDRWRVTGEPRAVNQSTTNVGQGQPAAIPDPVSGERPTPSLTNGITPAKKPSAAPSPRGTTTPTR